MDLAKGRAEKVFLSFCIIFAQRTEYYCGLNHHTFKRLVESWWSKNSICGWPGHYFIQKLKSLQRCIERVELLSLRPPHRTEIPASQRALIHQFQEDVGLLNNTNIQQRLDIKIRLLSLSVNEESMR